MSGTRRLSAVPSRRQQQVLDWLADSEGAPSKDVLDVAFAELPRVRQRRRWPWTRLEERLRPEPFGSQQARLVALAIAAMLLLVVFAGTVLTAGQRGFTGVVIEPAPNVTPEASQPAVFPLSNPPYDLVIVNQVSQLFTMWSDGTNRLPIGLDITGSLASPEWGPGDSAIVLDSTVDDDQIWRVDMTGDKRSLVIIPCVVPCQSRNEASWSHDGTRVVLFQAMGEPVNGIPVDCGLALYDAASQGITDVTSSPCAVIEERHPRFSPDDRSIAFWRSRSPGRIAKLEIEDAALFTRDLTTGAETQVTDWTTHATMLDWSPDGSWIVFVPSSWDPAATAADLWRVHPDGTGLERLTTIDTGSVRLLRPRYSPDGAWILFMRISEQRGELLAIPADGGEPVSVLPETPVFDFDVRAAD